MAVNQTHDYRVLQIITPSKLAGAEIFAGILSSELKKKGLDVLVLTKRLPKVVSAFKARGLDVEVGGISGKLNPRSIFRTLRLIKDKQIDIVNTHLSSATLTGSIAGRMCGVPVVATMHGLGGTVCYRMADHIIAVSEAVKRCMIEQGIPKERITVIYPGVDLERFTPSPALNGAREELGIPDDAFVVGVAAHLTPKKGHEVLLSAAREIVTRLPNCLFLLAGDGPMRDQLTEMSNEPGLKGKVIMTGFRNDIDRILQAVDVVAQPSTEGEGLPASIIQGMGLYKPVIASSISGIPEAVVHEKTGLLVKPGEPQELVDGILRLASDSELREAMGHAGRKRAEEVFDFKITVEKTISLYDSLLKSKD